ncbi:hypothetical protein [Leucobacter sp. Psy1]|uniref:hypothetical protein n=1 Tax=Leucobacter sp. Psy1 TaxID=2875729 RepID=UPI001CD4AD04|nr:hypothetical protein [Leucobacter sp. Psy1]
MNWDILVAAASAVLAFSAAGATAFTSRLRISAEKTQRTSLKSLNVEKVLAEPSLQDLGRLFVGNLGNTSLPSYVRDSETRRAFRRTFNVVVDYLGNSEVEQEKVAPQSLDGFSEVSPDTAAGKAVKDIEEGETWNALARMRRELEKVLGDLLNASTANGKPRGIGRSLSIASKQGLVPESVLQYLRFPLSVANAAIHGEEVEAGTALEAVQMIDQAISRIKSLPTP